jgi:hypothetical protein
MPKRMRDPNKPPNAVVGVKIRVDKGPTPEQIAIQIAEAYQVQANSSADAAAFKAQAMHERRRANELQGILFQLKERARNPPEKIRRMDPLAEYDADSLKEEMEIYKKRAQDLQVMADQATERVKKARLDAVRLQAEVKQARENHKESVIMFD